MLDRGDRRDEIFRDEEDRERFLATLGEACARTGWPVHAFVLMTNHYDSPIAHALTLRASSMSRLDSAFAKSLTLAGVPSMSLASQAAPFPARSVHLVLETPQPNLVAGMRWFQTTSTARFNRRHRLNGHLYQGRYKAVVVNPEEAGYFTLLSDYIHLNPVRAGMIRLEQRLFDYRWSSYRHYVSGKNRPAWFEPEAGAG